MTPPSLSIPNGLSLPNTVYSNQQEVMRAQPQSQSPSLRQLQFTLPPQGYMGNILLAVITNR